MIFGNIFFSKPIYKAIFSRTIIVDKDESM